MQWTKPTVLRLRWTWRLTWRICDDSGVIQFHFGKGFTILPSKRMSIRTSPGALDVRKAFDAFFHYCMFLLAKVERGV